MLCKFKMSTQQKQTVIVVQAQWIDTQTIKCFVKTSLSGVANVAVTLNGQDYSDDAPYLFYEQPLIASVSPIGLPAHLKSTVRITGTGFFNDPILAPTFQCSLVALIADSSNQLSMYIQPHPRCKPCHKTSVLVRCRPSRSNARRQCTCHSRDPMPSGIAGVESVPLSGALCQAVCKCQGDQRNVD